MADTGNARNWPERDEAFAALKTSVIVICSMAKSGSIAKPLAIELVRERVSSFTLFYGVADPEPMGFMHVNYKGTKQR